MGSSIFQSPRNSYSSLSSGLLRSRQADLMDQRRINLSPFLFIKEYAGQSC